MSEEERIEKNNRLNEGLRLSYEKMLKEKMLLGLDIVIGGKDGQPITISAREAWEKYQEDLKRESDKQE